MLKLNYCQWKIEGLIENTTNITTKTKVRTTICFNFPLISRNALLVNRQVVKCKYRRNILNNAIMQSKIGSLLTSINGSCGRKGHQESALTLELANNNRRNHLDNNKGEALDDEQHELFEDNNDGDLAEIEAHRRVRLLTEWHTLAAVGDDLRPKINTIKIEFQFSGYDYFSEHSLLIWGGLSNRFNFTGSGIFSVFWGSSGKKSSSD